MPVLAPLMRLPRQVSHYDAMRALRVSIWAWKFVILLVLCACSSSMNASEAEQAESSSAEQRARSDAEVLVQLEELISEDEARRVALGALDHRLTDSLQAASERFNELNDQLDSARAGLQRDGGAGDAGLSAPSVHEITEAWKAARDEVNELLQRKRAVAQQVGVVENIVAKEKEAVELITMHRIRRSETIPSGEPQPKAEEPSKPAPALPTSPLLLPFTKPAAATSASTAQPTDKLYDPEASEAERAFQKLAMEVELEEHRLRLVEQLIVLVEDDLNLARVTAKAAGDAADQRQVDMLEKRLAGLKHARFPVEASLRAVERRAERARQKLEFLQSPWSPQRMTRWLTSAGPRIAVIAIVLLLLWMLLRRLSRRLAASVITRGSYASEEERMQRVDTVQRAAKSGFSVGFFLLGALVLLPEFGVDITVLLGGAAVVSLAIAFGAQSLIKDYFAGVTILLENQYRVGNVVRINGTAGVVEDMTLRMTTLRDLEGTAHFVPHGQITNVSNLTHGWSRVVLDIRVAYREDVDRVIAVLRELGELMRTDPDFGHMIVDEPEMLGVDHLNPSEVVIRLLVKTRPLKQWPVKREFLRRIKIRFDALQIEFPFPQRAVHHRSFDAPIALVTRAEAEDMHEGEKRA